MPFAIASLAIGAYGAYSSSQAAKNGAQAQSNANNAAIGEQQREFNQTQANQQPFIDAGKNALNLQQQYLNGDTSGFMNAPDYQFAVQQGTKQLDAGAAAGGNLWGGGADADRIALGQGLATQYANNYWNKLAGQAGQGQVSAANLGQQGQQAASNIGSYLQSTGQANASSYAGQTNAWNNFGNQLSNFAGQQYGQGSSPSFGPGTIGSGI